MAPNVGAFIDEDVREFHTLSRTLGPSEPVLRGQILTAIIATPKLVDLSNATDRSIGIADRTVTQKDLDDGHNTMGVVHGGRVMCRAGAAVVALATIESDANGDGVTANLGDGTVTHHTVGIALTDADNAGELFTLLVSLGTHHAT